ncbi:MAG: DNA recombination protein RmuC [Oscillospiraceae bacterium]|nr:DNA recombination protein RmuC [Oscillospiraceae bacterium]
MQLETTLLILACALGAGSLILSIVLLSRLSRREQSGGEILQTLRQELLSEQRESRKETASNLSVMGDMMQKSQQSAFVRQDSRLDALTKGLSDSLRSIEERFKSYSMQSEQKLDNMRTTMENRLASLQEDNNKKLEAMRLTVDEKLQRTLEEKLASSFSLVNERLEQVYKGLGEMQTLATGVGDLKKVLSNVKTRGVLGEIQLGAILEQIMPPEQYEREVVTKPGSRERVEYAVKMPGEDGGVVYLPIDAKFPLDAYNELLEAYDSGESAKVDIAVKQLTGRIRLFAKDIRDKYLDPPNTTDFAILFLPVEGLYAEVTRQSGLLEALQRDYKVNIAGPTTMAALLNSLQMGFRTLAIQKRSGEVWKVLGAVKTEFETFGAVLAQTQQRLEQAGSELDKLVGVRTRQIQRKLKEVTAIPSVEESAKLLEE